MAEKVLKAHPPDLRLTYFYGEKRQDLAEKKLIPRLSSHKAAMTQTSKKHRKIKQSFLRFFLSFPRSQYLFPDRRILQLCGSGLEGLVLQVAAEVSPAMVAVDVMFAVESLPLLESSREEVTGWEEATKGIPINLQVGRKVFRDHCSSVQTGDSLPYQG